MEALGRTVGAMAYWLPSNDVRGPERMKPTRHVVPSILALGLAVGVVAAGAADESDPTSDARISVILDRARAELAAGAFGEAKTSAETALRVAPSRIRSTALTLGGDAAYGIGSYRTAAALYSEALKANQPYAEAAHAGFALGWSRLRTGHYEQARTTWEMVSRQFPDDPGAPIALVQAAELAAQGGDLPLAHRLFTRVVEQYPAGSEAQLAGLGRVIVDMRAGRTPEAVSELRPLVYAARPTLVRERWTLLEMLATAGSRDRRRVEMRWMTRYDPALAGGASTTPSPARAGAWERFAESFLERVGDADTPAVLHALVLGAAEDGSWPEAETLLGRLRDRFPTYAGAPGVLASVGDQASAAQRWSTARSAYERLAARDGGTGLSPEGRLNFAEALARTGAPAQAREQLRQARPSPRVLRLLAEADEALGEPREALEAYEQLRRDYPREWAESRMPQARLLLRIEGKEQEARALLEEVTQQAQGEARSEAAYRLGQLLAGADEHEQAVDLFMSAAYGTADPSSWSRPALLAAGRSLAALHRTEAALAVYRTLLPAAPLGPLPRDGRLVRGLGDKVEEPELAAEAAFGIAELLRGSGRNAEAVDMYLTAASLSPSSDLGWRGRVGAIRCLVATRDWPSAAAVYQRVVDSHRNAPAVIAEARNALGPPRRDTSSRVR
jgi:tetratricopeptide (TPR) repeat protein